MFFAELKGFILIVKKNLNVSKTYVIKTFYLYERNNILRLNVSELTLALI